MSSTLIVFPDISEKIWLKKLDKRNNLQMSILWKKFWLNKVNKNKKKKIRELSKYNPALIKLLWAISIKIVEINLLLLKNIYAKKINNIINCFEYLFIIFLYVNFLHISEVNKN